MSKRNLVRLFALVLVAAVAVGTALTAQKVNPAKGKVFYKTKTMAQWNREFGEKGTVGDCAGRVEEKTSYKLTPQDLLDIQAFLVQHAADLLIHERDRGVVSGPHPPLIVRILADRIRGGNGPR